MRLTTWIAALSCTALLSACDSMPKAPVAVAPAAAPAPIGAMLAAAGEAAKLGQADKAQNLLRSAAAAYPADKEPWMRLAQRSMEAKHYREALNHALEVLARDSEDRAALGIVVLSGARVAGAAADQLARGPLWSGATRSEAQEVVKRLHVSVGDGAKPATAPRHATFTAPPPLPGLPAPVAGAPATAPRGNAGDLSDPVAALRGLRK